MSKAGDLTLVSFNVSTVRGTRAHIQNQPKSNVGRCHSMLHRQLAHVGLAALQCIHIYAGAYLEFISAYRWYR